MTTKYEKYKSQQKIALSIVIGIRCLEKWNVWLKTMETIVEKWLQSSGTLQWFKSLGIKPSKNVSRNVMEVFQAMLL